MTAAMSVETSGFGVPRLFVTEMAGTASVAEAVESLLPVREVVSSIPTSANHRWHFLPSGMYTETVVVRNPPKIVGPSHTALHVYLLYMLTYNRTEPKYG